MSVLIFLLVLFILVLVHEWGHFIVAKKTGMRVDEFGIGFPPKLFGVKKGETEYTFNALPIGGFVKIYGENYEDELVGHIDKDPRGFSSRPRWAQALVLVAGVTMNILFAWLLFSVTYMVGMPTQVDETTASPQAYVAVVGVMPDSPAADLPIGAEIVAIDLAGSVTYGPTQSDFTEIISGSEGQTVSVTYEYAGEEKILTMSPSQGLIESDEGRYAVGVSLATIDIVKKSFFVAIKDGLISTVDGLVAIAVGLYSLVSQAFVGQADFSQVAGPVGIVGMVGDAAEFGLTALLTFTAIISLNLAIINLLPFPALDGGRLMFVAIESIIRRPINPVWTARVNFIGFALLILLMVAVTYSDITKIL